MADYRFHLIINDGFSQQVSNEEFLDATDALGEVGCTDCSVTVADHGLELEFDRPARTLDQAVRSAITDVNAAGFRVARIEIELDGLISQQLSASGAPR